MIYKSREELLDAGYNYALCSLQGDYLNSAWTKKETAEAALQGINNRSTRNFYCPLVLMTNHDLL